MSEPNEYSASDKLYLTWRLRERLLTDHGGWDGVVQWLYAWSRRPDGTRVTLDGNPATLRQYVTEDAHHWHELRKTKPDASSPKDRSGNGPTG